MCVWQNDMRLALILKSKRRIHQVCRYAPTTPITVPASSKTHQQLGVR